MLQQMAHDLAASKQGKSAQVVWSRALLHQLAAQAQIQEGKTYHTGSHVNREPHCALVRESAVARESAYLNLCDLFHQLLGSKQNRRRSACLHRCTQRLKTAEVRGGGVLRKCCFCAACSVPQAVLVPMSCV